jgi:hypothetical protein
MVWASVAFPALGGSAVTTPSRTAVAVVGPLLHHLLALGQVGGAIVGTAVGISHGVGQLMLDEIGPHAEHLGADGTITDKRL